MKKVKVKIINKSHNPLPKYQTNGAAGMDIRAFLDKPVTIRPTERSIIPTGLFWEIPKGYEIQIRSRSGLAHKAGVCLANGIGTIDSDYRGEIGILLINHGTKDFTVNSGDRIAQLIISEVPQIEWEEVKTLEKTVRADKGFGKTGLK
jgi:dUTP pyrophosphatase